jgi:fructokinase
MAGLALAGLELGGTKCVCTLGTGPTDVREQRRLPTTTPAETLAALRAVLDEWRARHGRIAALGIASFGPLDLDARSPTYGRVLASAKPGWLNVDLLGALADGVDAPVGFDTDVNAAALAEGRWGAARGLDDYAYVTVGTGIGVGLVTGGRLVHGGGHTELGHVRVGRHPGDTWPGICPYHGDCVEGLASGPAIAARAGRPAAELEPGDPAWALAAHALGGLLHTLVFATAPRRILVGGGVATGRPALLAAARRAMAASVAGFVDLDRLAGGSEALVAPPALGDQAGPLGAIALAADALAAAGTTGAPRRARG